MKTLISALVISAASILPVSAGIHDFTPANSAPTPTRNKAEVGQGQCLNTRDKSRVCYVKTSATDFSISIRDIDYPNAVEVAFIDCSTGRWGAYGDLPRETLDLYLDDFCTHFG